MPELKEILNSINYEKKSDLLDDYNKSDYIPYVVNRIFSFFPDTVLFANEMNKVPHLDNILQYKYLLYGIRKAKRYSKWLKRAEENEKIINFIARKYNISFRRARNYLDVLPESVIQELKSIMEKE